MGTGCLVGPRGGNSPLRRHEGEVDALPSKLRVRKRAATLRRKSGVPAAARSLRSGRRTPKVRARHSGCCPESSMPRPDTERTRAAPLVLRGLHTMCPPTQRSRAGLKYVAPPFEAPFAGLRASGASRRLSVQRGGRAAFEAQAKEARPYIQGKAAAYK